MNDRLRVALRRERVAARQQIAAQIAIVVNLAVKDNPDRLVLVRDRLVARMQVDNAEPPHPDRTPAIEMKPVVIRSPVPNGRAHPLHVRKLGGLVTEEKTGDTAHLTHS